MGRARKLFLVAGIGAGLLGWRRTLRRRGEHEVTFDWDVPPPPKQVPADNQANVSDHAVAPEPPGGGVAVDILATEETATDSGRGEREEESRRADDTKFGETVERESQERSELAESLREDPLTERPEGSAG